MYMQLGFLPPLTCKEGTWNIEVVECRWCGLNPHHLMQYFYQGEDEGRRPSFLFYLSKQV